MNYDNMSQWLMGLFKKDKHLFDAYLRSKSRQDCYVKSVPLHKELDLVISYPGFKTTPQKKDYVVRLDGKNISHQDIARDLHDKAQQLINDSRPVTQLRQFILDLAWNGLAVNLDDYPDLCMLPGYSLEKLQGLIPWIALQEDINYPISSAKQGRKMPFRRYLEALYAAQHPEKLSLDTVFERINFHGRPPEDYCEFDYGNLADIT